MNCHTCEELFADALGGELSEAQRGEFDAHLADCPACRAAFAGDSAAVGALRSLSAPVPQTLESTREAWGRTTHPASAPGAPHPGHHRVLGAGPARLAASLLIAFTAGYVARWMTAPHGDLAGSAGVVSVDLNEGLEGRRPAGVGHAGSIARPTGDWMSEGPAGSVQEALVRSYAGRRGGSDFARGLAALFER